MLLPTRLHQYYHSLAELPSCVTPSLDYYKFRSRAPLTPRSRRIFGGLRAVSITRFIMGAFTRVREYQPVVHRLRLSASPSVPPYPGRISLAQEPLVIRRTSFSLVFRYSCLHSHSHSVHGWITPPLQPLHDAPLPIPAQG